MNRRILYKVSLCIISFASVIYAYLEDMNAERKLRMILPGLEKQLAVIHEENSRLKYEIEQFESPANLLKLAKCCEFSHLYHPYADDILVVAVPTHREMETAADQGAVAETFSWEGRHILVGAK